jgi:hypothetical protein
VLSPAIGLFCHRRRRKFISADLTPASRRQDHTSSPSATGAYVYPAFASTASRTNVCDVRNAPHSGRDGGICTPDFVSEKQKYFFNRGWTRQKHAPLVICPVGQPAGFSAVTRRAKAEGVLAAFDRAIAADPGFALAHAGRARAPQISSDIAGAQAAIAAAQALANGLPERDSRHIEVFSLRVGGKPDAALIHATPPRPKQWRISTTRTARPAPRSPFSAPSSRTIRRTATFAAI